jgi:hypothetical protein
MPDNESQLSKKEREAKQELEDRLTRQGESALEAERKALQATNHEPGGGKKSDTRTGEREKD